MSEGTVFNAATNSILFSVVGQPDDYKYVNVNPATVQFEEGDCFPISTLPYNMMYVITDAYDNPVIPCPFSISINEFQNPTGALACNDLVQVSLDENCETIVTPDMLLEGTNYGCYDKYKVQIIGNNGIVLGNKVTKAQMQTALKTAIRWAKMPYNLMNNSCTTIVQVGLINAGILNIKNFDMIPNQSFKVMSQIKYKPAY